MAEGHIFEGPPNGPSYPENIEDIYLGGDVNKFRGFIGHHGATAAGVFIGVAAVVCANVGNRRPVFSGIQKHIAFGVGGGVFAKFLQHRQNVKASERDAMFRHYIQLHREDFPHPERKKYADVLKPWVPIH